MCVLDHFCVLLCVHASLTLFDLCCSYVDHVDMVKFLVSKGANKATKGSDGKTAKESTGNPDILALL